MRVFLNTPHASYALFLYRLEASEASAEDSVDARPAQDNFFFETVIERFMKEHRCQAQLLRANIELVCDPEDMRRRSRFDVEPLVNHQHHSRTNLKRLPCTRRALYKLTE